MSFNLEISKQLHILNETTVNTIQSHLSHIEDLVIEGGTDKFLDFVQHVQEILKGVEGLESTQHVAEKIDGSMSVYFGIDPRPNFKGQFSIATKSALSKNPKLIHSLDEIETLYPDKDDVFKQHLGEVFVNLQKAYDYSGKIYTGDLLFSNPAEKKSANIDGTEYLYFKPNTVVYAVAEDPKSDLYNRLKEATLGIIIHDSYIPDSNGEKLELKSAGKNIDELIQKGKETHVFIESSYIPNLNLKVPKKDYTEVQRLLKKAAKEIENITPEFNAYWVNSSVLSKLKKYICQQVHLPNGGIFGNGGRSFNAYKLLEDFIPFVHGSYKNPKNAAHATSLLKEQEDQFIHLLEAFYYMLLIKNKLLDLFDQVESKIGKTFIQQGEEFVPTRGEGFVLVHQGKFTKLVDRLNFTRNNKLFGRFNESTTIVLTAKNPRKVFLEGAKPTLDSWMDPNGVICACLRHNEQHIDYVPKILMKYFPKMDISNLPHWTGYEFLLNHGFLRCVEGIDSIYYAEAARPPNPKQKRELINLCIENQLNILIWTSSQTDKTQTIWQRESSGNS